MESKFRENFTKEKIKEIVNQWEKVLVRKKFVYCKRGVGEVLQGWKIRSLSNKSLLVLTIFILILFSAVGVSRFKFQLYGPFIL